MAESKPEILVVEDDLDVADMLAAYFRTQDYEVLTVNWGEDALLCCSTSLPNLIILDIRLPDIDGFEVARRLRLGRRTKSIPILFLTERRERDDRLHGLELGADDYITKPFDVQELGIRVHNTLQRVAHGALTNPVTQLPDGLFVNSHLKKCLSTDGWAILSISLENINLFRDQYGFVASDDVIRAVSLMIQNAVREMGGVNDFIGHLSPTQFFIITVPGVVPDLVNRLRSRLEQSLDYFYPIKDQTSSEDKESRLHLRLGKLFATQGPFTSLKELKSQLARQ